jgi:hypothetical protein
MYQLSIELCQSRLTSIVEDEHSINHYGLVVRYTVIYCAVR